MSGIPDGVGTQNSQLAAHLHDLAHFLHLHDLAEVGEQALVLAVDEAPGPDLEGEIGTLEAITLDGGLQVAVSLSLLLQSAGQTPSWQRSPRGRSARP